MNFPLLVLGMAAVTFLPRLLPFLAISADKLPLRLRRFLEYIPYAALGALIVPGVFSSAGGKPYFVIAGLLFSVVYSWFKGGIIVPVLGAVALTYGSMLIF